MLSPAPRVDFYYRSAMLFYLLTLFAVIVQGSIVWCFFTRMNELERLTYMMGVSTGGTLLLWVLWLLI